MVVHFNPIIVLFLTLSQTYDIPQLDHFNPIIVLFLTSLGEQLIMKIIYFNPIIVLFLTTDNPIYIIFKDSISILL